MVFGLVCLDGAVAGIAAQGMWFDLMVCFMQLMTMQEMLLE
jgi:hypothetical protein